MSEPAWLAVVAEVKESGDPAAFIYTAAGEDGAPTLLVGRPKVPPMEMVGLMKSAQDKTLVMGQVQRSDAHNPLFRTARTDHPQLGEHLKGPLAEVMPWLAKAHVIGLADDDPDKGKSPEAEDGGDGGGAVGPWAEVVNGVQEDGEPAAFIYTSADENGKPTLLVGRPKVPPMEMVGLMKSAQDKTLVMGQLQRSAGGRPLFRTARTDHPSFESDLKGALAAGIPWMQDSVVLGLGDEDPDQGADEPEPEPEAAAPAPAAAAPAPQQAAPAAAPGEPEPRYPEPPPPPPDPGVGSRSSRQDRAAARKARRAAEGKVRFQEIMDALVTRWRRELVEEAVDLARTIAANSDTVPLPDALNKKTETAVRAIEQGARKWALAVSSKDMEDFINVEVPLDEVRDVLDGNAAADADNLHDACSDALRRVGEVSKALFGQLKWRDRMPGHKVVRLEDNLEAAKDLGADLLDLVRILSGVPEAET
ncbi:MAG: hypothetical protein H6739_34955 [Alphaproteobacteria bacterium]|nr:hypothetical protein [Alphaproteobacteria bacterium]